ncbi:MAG TPA: SLBB domain-containing protein [Gemmatimonadaceae bacterium]
MTMSYQHWLRTIAIACIGVTVASRSGRAQATAADAGPELESRSTLEAEAAKAEAQHRKSEAWLLRTRLQKGDFQDGDRIIVKLLGQIQLPGNDTVTVRAGKVLPLPQMADLPLEGVLRSELQPKLSSHIARYLRDSTVRATPLLRMAVLGQVRNPGYYYVQADVLLNDVVMKAGGPIQTADVGNMIIRRGTDIIWNAQDTRTALADGMSLDRLHLRAGDELYVDDIKGSIDWTKIVQFAGPVVGLLVTWKRFFP